MKDLYLPPPHLFSRLKCCLILLSISETLLSFTSPLSAMDMDMQLEVQRQPLNNLETSPLFYAPRQHSSCQTNVLSSSKEVLIEDSNLVEEALLAKNNFVWHTYPLSISKNSSKNEDRMDDTFSQKEKKQDHKKRRNSESYYVVKHPLTQLLWRERDFSPRIKELRNNNTNTTKNFLTSFEKAELEYCKKTLSYNYSDHMPIPGLSIITLEDLKINSMNPKNAHSENSHTEVTILSHPNGKIAIKKFTDLQLGLKELFRSLEALEMNPAPHKLKMAGIFDAIINPRNELSIIMEGAETLELEKCLSELFAQHAVTACAKYLAKLHIKSDKRLASKPMNKKKYIENLGNVRNRENYIKNLANAQKTLSYDLLQAEINEDELLFLNKGSPRVVRSLYTGPINAGTIFRSLPLNYLDKYDFLIRKVIKSFIGVTREIYRSLNDALPDFYLITATHGDAHLGNFFYNHLADGKETPWDSCLRICAIDFASMARSIDGDNPAVDVARFAASLGTKGYFELRKLFNKTYENEIVNSGIIEDIEKYKNSFKMSYDFFYLRFLKTIFNLPQEKMADQTKIDILKRWIDENSAHIPFLEEIGNNIIHCLPNPVDVFIENTSGGSQSYLEFLENNMAAGCSAVIIGGLKGVGKKSLALEIAHRALKNKNYNLIYWIPSTTQFSLLKAYKNLLLDLGIPVHDKTENEIIELVMQQAPQKGKCLLIYAGAPNAEFLKDKIPANNVTIITSQDPEVEQWKNLFPSSKSVFLEVDVFRPEESRQYLYKATGFANTVKTVADGMEESIIDDLAEALGHHPLSLATAASSIRLTSDSNNILNNCQNFLYVSKKYSIIHGDPFEKESSQPIDENIID